MPTRPNPIELEVRTNDLIKPGKVAWTNHKGDVFVYTKLAPLPGQTEPREQPPRGLSYGIIVHPEDYEKVMDLIARNELRY